MKTFTLTLKSGSVLTLNINSKNTLHFNDGGNHENGGVIYRGKRYKVSGQGGVINNNLDFELQCWEANGNNVRFVKPDDSTYYRTNGLYFHEEISYAGKGKVYEIIKTEINEFIKKNKEKFRAAFTEAEKSDIKNKYNKLIAEEKELRNQADQKDTDATILNSQYLEKFGKNIDEE